MDDKTEELREVFRSVSDTDTVTEDQEETPGSLTDRPDVDERLAEVVATMRDRYDFTTDLDDDALCDLIESFYDGATDAELGRELDVTPATVFRARMDLHLFRDRDTDAPFDLADLRDRRDEADTMADLADDLDVGTGTLRRYRRVLTARDEARRANHRFRTEFDELLGDGDLAARLADGVREDGLDDATEGLETNVSF